MASGAALNVGASIGAWLEMVLGASLEMSLGVSLGVSLDGDMATASARTRGRRSASSLKNSRTECRVGTAGVAVNTLNGEAA